MRFQQLKHDPNTIEKKRLVKSKKNWVVLSSLSIAGGLFLLSAPSVLVKADTTNDQVQTTLTAKAPSTETQSATDKLAAVVNTTTDNTAKKTATDQTAAVSKPTATPVSSTTDTKESGAVETQTVTPETGTTSTDSTQADTSKADTTENVNSKTSSDTTTTESKDTPVAEKTLATNLAISKTKLANLGVKAELLSITPEATTLPDGNIAESTQGTTPWYISADGVLHLGTASSTTALADNTATTTNKTSESTDKTSTGSSTTGTTTASTTPTSPWATNAESINTIIFDGKVTAATDMNHMFANLTNLKSIKNIDNLDVSNTENTSGMFANDTNLVDATNAGETHTADNQKLNLSSLNWFFVKNSSKMFLNDSSVTEIDLPADQYSTFAQSTDDSYMFKNDINLKTVNLANWQFRNHKDLTGMFQNDANLTNLDLSTWDMTRSPVPNETGDSSIGQGMFDGTNLNKITLSKYNRFKSYTDLPSKASNHWYDSNNNIKFSTLAANDNGQTLGTLFTDTVPAVSKINLVPNPDETVTIINATMSIPSNLGNQNVTVQGTLNSAVTDVKVPQLPGYKSDISKVNGTIINDTTATTNYYITYTGNPVNTWTASVKLPDGSTKEITGTKNDAGENPRVGDKVTFNTPTVAGYDVTSSTITGTINSKGDVDFDNPTYSQKQYTNTVTIKSNFPDQTVSVTGPVGPVKIDVPKADGYTASPSQITGTINSDGTITLDPNQDITYTGNPVTSASATIKATQNGTTKLPDISVAGISGNVGDTVDVKVPTKEGYTSPESVKGIIQPDGKTVLVKEPVNYVGVAYTDSPATIKSNLGDQHVDHLSGKVGETVTVNVPNVEGYTADKSTVTGLMNPGGSITSTDVVTYTPKKIDTGTATINTPKGNKVISGLTGTVDEKGGVTIKVPDVQGYTPDKSTITGTMNPNGTVTPNETVNYTPNNIKNVTTTISTSKGDKTVSGLTGTVDEKGGVTIKVPDVQGYTPDKSTITGTMNPNGTVTPNETVNYTPNDIKDVSTIISTSKGDKTVSGLTGTVDKKDGVTIKVPDVQGYTPDKSTITGTMNPDGTVTTNETVNYTPNNIKDASTTISTSKGNKTVSGLTGTVDKKDGVTIKVPDVQGYTPDKSTITGTMNPDGTVTPSETVNYTPNTVNNGKITISTPNGNKTISNLTGTVDNKNDVNIKVPDVQGYTPDKSTITGTMNPDGTVTTDEKVNYTPKDIKGASTTISTPKGSKTISGLTGTVDEKGGVTIKVPDVQGYTPDKSTITGTMNPDGTVTPNETVNYTPNNIKDVTTTISTSKGDKTVSGLTGTVDKKDGVTIKVPDVQGYTPDKSTITGTMNSDGTVTTNETVNYTPNNIKDVTTIISTSKGDKTVTGLNGVVDAKNGVTITVPDVQGYTPDKSTITGTMNPDGTITPNETVNYIPNNIKNASITINTPKGSKTISGLNGTVDKKGGVTIKVPDVQGYTPDKSTITGTMESDGTVTPDEKVNYTPNDIKDVTATISTSKGNKTVSGLTGIVDDKNGVTIKVPDVPGYTPDKPTITGTMNPDGTVTPSETVNYTPNAVNNGKITISTPDGDKTITNLTGTVDNKNGVTIKVPDVQGYTPDKSTITGTMNPDGTVTPNEKVTYTGNPVNNQSLNIPTTKDSKDAIQTITGLSGKVGDTLEVVVPKIDGYSSNVRTVKAIINPDGSITTADKVIYTKILSNNNNSNVTGNETTLEMKYQTISTYADKPDVQVYGLDSDNTMTAIKGRILPHHTNWKSDAVITIDGTTYYRVATNEFVKTIQAYPYEALNLYIRTYNDSAKPLYRAEEDLIANKTLAPSSSWITDRKAYFINGEKYYRVATNEFVKATDVYVYSPVKMTVAAHSDSSKKVYDAKGQLVENYVLNANSNWKADSIAYINGDKYYRVATNKFVKADDVYVYTPAKLVVTTHADSAKNVYNDKGQLVKARTLGASSNWLADATTYINGVKYYRVATDEFIKADDVDIRR